MNTERNKVLEEAAKVCDAEAKYMQELTEYFAVAACSTLADKIRKLKSAESPVAQPQDNSHIVEALSWHANERDDLTLDDAIEVIRQGWKTVHGRTERQLVLQIAGLLSASPVAQPQDERERFEAECAKLDIPNNSVVAWKLWGSARATPSQDAVAAHRYRVLRDSKYQIDEDDPCVTDAFFNAFFDDDLDKKVDELEARYIAAMQAQGAKE